MDWHAWHDEYDQSDTPMARRLRVVQEHIRDALDAHPAGPIRALSLCAGQGRDLLGVLADHPRRADVTARLVELDPRNAAVARKAAPPQVEVVVGDAGVTSHYADFGPADLALLCGVFGNLNAADIERTIAVAPGLCRPGATLIWTRHREPPDLVPQVCAWFEACGFERRWVSDPDAGFGVGVHRYTGQPRSMPPDQRIFTFGSEPWWRT